MSFISELQQVLDLARTGEIERARGRLADLPDPAWASRRDRLLGMLSIHDLWLAPLSTIGAAVELQLDVRLIELKTELERLYIGEIDQAARNLPVDDRPRPSAVEAMRKLAVVDLVPRLYRWLADEASLDQLERYLALEGGPDGGFDDLVAICQVGISGRAKVELGRNFWDEMGRGELAEVHTNLHEAMAVALDLDVPPRDEVPVEALARAALGSLLATNRALQPEMVGALGFIELQAGPRSREVAKGLRRVGAPESALPFYDEHATADPRHGKAWLDEVVAPLSIEHPSWGPRIVKGARWRAAVNGQFFAWASQHFAIDDRASVAHECVGVPA